MLCVSLSHSTPAGSPISKLLISIGFILFIMKYVIKKKIQMKIIIKITIKVTNIYIVNVGRGKSTNQFQSEDN